MEQYITESFIGLLVTIEIQAIINTIYERVKHKRELLSWVFQRKLEVVEKIISWCQETLDIYYMLKKSDKNCNPIMVQKIQITCMRSNKLFQETESRLNSTYLYYDFSDVEKKYHKSESMNCINKLLTLISELGHKIATIELSKFTEQLRATLNEQRVKAPHMLGNAIDNQTIIIAVIGKRLRIEYKEFFNK